jgi:hypothetical protein
MAHRQPRLAATWQERDRISCQGALDSCADIFWSHASGHGSLIKQLLAASRINTYGFIILDQISPKTSTCIMSCDEDQEAADNEDF